jgi:two-component sensor histidine kinase
LSIRVRLGAALAVALAPILLLGAAQSVVAMRHDADERRLILTAAAERGAAVARARMQSAEVILETLTPQAIGFECAPRLRAMMQRLPGYANLIRLDGQGRVVCAADTVGADPGRVRSTWFDGLRSGRAMTVASAPSGIYSSQPAVIAAVRETGPDGRFEGALAAVVLLSSLKPDLSDRSLPQGTQVALVDRNGDFLIRTDKGAFAPIPRGVLTNAGLDPMVYKARDPSGQSRVYTAAPLINDVGVVLSAPDRGLFSWARLNPLSALLLPLAAFSMALAAVWVVAEHVVVRWLHYLDRIAAIYARGRFTVRPVKAAYAPPEIRHLAHTLEVMADAIVNRDLSLRDSLTQKDDLMREIHHRVKNNLQVISSLLNMQQRSLSDPAARSAISDTRQRIGALALIYRALYQGADMRRVDLRQFLEELIGQLMAADADNQALIRTDLEADELTVDPDKLAPLALFAVEAIGNARKHAFATGGVLHVRFRLEGEEACLEIADEGSKGEEPAVGEGVGRTLMEAFARQLRGRTEITPNVAGGVTVRLMFPAPEAWPVEPLPAAGPILTSAPQRPAPQAGGQAAA